MNSQNDLSSQLALDVKGMGALRQSAKAGSPDALKATATQFESLFVNMMLKSMRDAAAVDDTATNLASLVILVCWAGSIIDAWWA